MQHQRIIRRPEVEGISGLGCSSIYEKMADGTFPKNVPLSRRAVGWVESEIYQWVADKIKEARKLQAMEAKAEEVAA